MPSLKGKGRGRNRGAFEGLQLGDISEIDDDTCPIPPPVPVIPGVTLSTPEKQWLSLEALGLALKHKSPLRPILPSRPNTGTVGRKIKLFSNCFRLQIPNGLVYHYDVHIETKNQMKRSIDASPAVRSTKNDKLNREVINTMFKKYEQLHGYNPAYDGQKNLFTRKPLIPAPFKYEVQLGDKTCAQSKTQADRNDFRTYVVTIRPVHKKETKSCAISLDPLHALFLGQTSTVSQEAVMALETILRTTPCYNLLSIGRSFFHPPANGAEISLGGGCEIWYGYHQSMRLGQWSPLVNIDLSSSAFYEDGPLLKHICHNILNCSEENLNYRPILSEHEIRRITKELRNLKIEVNHLPYKKKCRILRLTREPSNKLSFEVVENGKFIRKTVSQYFREKYHINLKYPQLPCIQVGPEAKRTFFPIETCNLVSAQQFKRALDEKQRQQMIKFTSRPPRERLAEINDILRNANFNEDKVCQEFDLKIDPSPVKVLGRVMEAPSVLYNNQQFMRPTEGTWNMRNMKFFKAAEIKNWVAISFAPPDSCTRRDLENFISMLCATCNDCGICMKKPTDVQIIQARNSKVENILNNFKNQTSPDFALIVLDRESKSLYGDIKHVSETMLGLKTQCVKEETVKKSKPATVLNLCLKINAKMGGINTSSLKIDKPKLFGKPVIIIGADVSHPGSFDSIKLSLAAVVGSLDSHPSRYAVTCRAQIHQNPNKQAIEIIMDLKNMVESLLLAFYQSTRGKKPEKIIFYRDGVSEGQFDQVRQYEVRAIRQACQSLDPEYEPGITFVVTQKRHHVRLFSADPRDQCGRMRNVPPGTIVDTTITDPQNFDFFLCSHLGIQGTSRPAHYTVLEDDNGFNADELQQLTYYLCHTYVRCTKSISIPAPVMYAHLAAFRARQHLLAQNNDCQTEEFDYSQIGLQNITDTIQVVKDLQSSMYFV